MHVWALGLSCETPAAPPDRAAGAGTRQPENSKRAHLSVPTLQTPPKFHEKTPREGRKERILRREGEKRAKFWASHPSGLHPSGLHPSGLHSSGLHPSGLHPSGLHPSGLHPSGPTFSGFGPHPSGPPPFWAPPFGPPPLLGSTLRAPTLRAPTFSGFGPPPFGPPPFGPPPFGPPPFGPPLGLAPGLHEKTKQLKNKKTVKKIQTINFKHLKP